MRLTKRGALELRRKQACSSVRAIQENYRFETVSNTPFSSDARPPDYTVIGTRDRYGFPVRIALCNRTGIVFLLDRLTREEYSRFYSAGDYRRLVDSYKGRSNSGQAGLVALEKRAESSADETIRALDGLIPLPKDGSVLDIGGGSGQLALALRDKFKLHPTVIDPSEAELRAAQGHGLETRLGQFETMQFRVDETYDVVVLHQTIEHIADLQATIKQIRQLLSPHGIFVFDFLDFLDQLELYGCVEGASRLDHCHWLYYEMLETFLALSGLRRLAAIRSRPGVFLIACEAATGDPDVQIGAELGRKLVREFARRQVQFENMEMAEAFSVPERIGRRLRMKVGPF